LVNHKNINRICVIITIVTLLSGLVFSYFGEALGLTAASKADLSYVSKLFDDSKVHTIDIEINEENWNTLQENAVAKEYQICNVIVDGETLENVAIRAKGNSSLTSVASSDSERYSLKIEFDKYSDGLTYHGLDKLNLNNLISDNTYLKDYISYDMMNYMGVDAPLTSFVRVSVNGEYFGLYLAVEGVEDAFAQRNYGSDIGNLYKPDNMEMGGNDQNGNGMQMPDMSQMPEMPQTTTESETNQVAGQAPQAAQGQPPSFTHGGNQDGAITLGENNQPDMNQFPDMSQIGNMGGNSGNDVALIYSDDELSSYDNIWNNAIFDVTAADKQRLIASIKALNAGENLDAVVDVDEVLKYFVVHSFVNNYDSYTGSMKHNYYLREKDGQLSVIPWDYNLGFMMFAGMGGTASTTQATTDTATTDTATTLVNYPIDTPVSGITMAERPLLNELLSNETYLNEYHQYYEEFITGYFKSGRCEETIDQAVALISEDVKTDPTAFCTYQEFETAVSELKEYCQLRSQSVSGQLEGTIPATTDGQAEQTGSLISASSLDISAMGSSMGGLGDNQGAAAGKQATSGTDNNGIATAQTQQPGNGQMSGNNLGGGRPPGGMQSSDATTSATTSNPGSTENATGQSSGVSTDTGNQKGSGNNNAGMTVDFSALALLAGSALLLVMGILITRLFRR
jgi:spore coat protein CotH